MLYDTVDHDYHKISLKTSDDFGSRNSFENTNCTFKVRIRGRDSVCSFVSLCSYEIQRNLVKISINFLCEIELRTISQSGETDSELSYLFSFCPCHKFLP